jgi:hypothetical protein
MARMYIRTSTRLRGVGNRLTISQTGLDLVDVQIPLDVLSEETRRRISWVHGNL